MILSDLKKDRRLS